MGYATSSDVASHWDNRWVGRGDVMTINLDRTSHFHAFTFDRLDELSVRWHEAKQPPDDVHQLSGGEFDALVLACGYDHLLHRPLVNFLLLDGWLQRWVLRRRGWVHLDGAEIGAVAPSVVGIPDGDCAESACSRLEELRSAWGIGEPVPAGVFRLPTTEFNALAMACGQWSLLPHSIQVFMGMNGDLQRWVLRRLSMDGLIGTRIGAGRLS